MRTTYLKQTTIAAATIALLLGAAGCTGDEDAEPTLEPAPAGGVSDSGGAEPPEEQPGDETVTAAEECSSKDGGEALPNEAPAVDAWVDVEGTAVPTSDTYGPHVRSGADDAVWTCYEHSPSGALFATFYVFAALGNVEGVTEEWIADSEVKDRLLATESTSDGGAESGSMTPVAYRFVSYSPEKSVIDAVMEYGGEGGTGYVSMRFPLTWEDDAWKIDGEQYIDSRPTPLTTLDGYTKWSNDG